MMGCAFVATDSSGLAAATSSSLSLVVATVAADALTAAELLTRPTHGTNFGPVRRCEISTLQRCRIPWLGAAAAGSAVEPIDMVLFLFGAVLGVAAIRNCLVCERKRRTFRGWVCMN